ncbi:hypothetical protein [Chamaesiphon polymorphus]|uniref:Secreted protein n=1 Tax=Chamaesiphon polymorphus CCALA 037 TaxID=2107692 RepID=A0A2T1GCU7_9CYAN|nr:hypothetical protein [Chamaesiphon polymorphus]PSB55258.1 hypothetical protein C7B77_15600 [Chamaesiphon polymorphus CCALA 037]
MKKIWSLAAIAAIVLPLAPAAAAPISGICDVLGNAPIGSDAVSSVAASGAESSDGIDNAGFTPEVQAKLNAIGSTLTASSLSGSQTVGGTTVEVDPGTAQAALDAIGSPVGADNPSVKVLATALGGSDAAQQLAKSMQGLRRSDGSIDPVVLTGAVDSYNNYVKYLIDSNQITQKPTSELSGFLQSLPVGQKVAQVVLSKLTEAARVE